MTSLAIPFVLLLLSPSFEIIGGTPLEEYSEYINCVSSDCAKLNINNVGVTGTIPTEIGQLTRLTRLKLANNDMQGTIPSEIGKLTLHNRQMSLQNLGLAGTLPTELGAVTSTRAMLFGGNSFSGTLPTELGELRSLTGLWLAANSLTGTLPTELGSWTIVKSIGLESNSLTGTLPAQLTQLTAVTALSVPVARESSRGSAWLKPHSGASVMAREGDHTLEKEAHALWADELRHLAIAHLELEVVITITQAFQREVKGFADVAPQMRLPAGSAFRVLLLQPGVSFLLLDLNDIDVCACFIQSAVNEWADGFSLTSTSSAGSSTAIGLTGRRSSGRGLGMVDGCFASEHSARLPGFYAQWLLEDGERGMVLAPYWLGLGLRTFTHTMLAIVTFGRADTDAAMQHEQALVNEEELTVKLHQAKGSSVTKRRLTIPLCGPVQHQWDPRAGSSESFQDQALVGECTWADPLV
ncbi:hypothetical protein CYMTET_51439 [Cymbomonas tetramitiformis]|uniref:L domain-like protein n=1 Tax=Cymbomonas tetramitiformis TaxID=36881 RepID=A0AAE0BL22_9CHLO|nr:hypothetical protein CYMTET_51439 [Cymbomonas tetramitiformis]